MMYPITLLLSWIGNAIGYAGSTGTWFGEHGLVENLQASVLIVAMMLFLLRAIESTKRASLLFALGGSLFSLSCALREVDVEHLNLPSVLIFLGSGIGRDVVLGSLWVIFAGFAWVNRVALLQQFKQAIASRFGSLVLLAAGFILTGMVFDKGWLPDPGFGPFVLEESCELVGYAVFCMSVYGFRWSHGHDHAKRFTPYVSISPSHARSVTTS